MHANLSFEQAPPISAPFRFLLTAPWFGVAAGCLLAWLGPDVLVSRWTPGALALTHLLTVGFMLQAMCGALLQFVPVAAGGNVRRPLLLASLVHPAVVVGALVLASAFIVGKPGWFAAAVPLLVCTLAVFVAAVGYALWRTPARGPTVAALRLAVVGLLTTLTLGTLLAAAFTGSVAAPVTVLANVHAAWGLGGWALMLLAGVSFFVVPMFQLTPAYPARISRWLLGGLFATLVLWSLQLATPADTDWFRPVLAGGLLLAGLFGATTLDLQRRRRRRVTDPTFMFFRGAMASLLLIALIGVLMALLPEPMLGLGGEIWLGILALVGTFVSAINGMLYKIVPFLCWLHLQRTGGTTIQVPNVRAMIAEAAMRRQMYLHFGALSLLLAAVPMPQLARPAGVVFAASCAWLGWNLLGAVRVYRRFTGRIRAVATFRES